MYVVHIQAPNQAKTHSHKKKLVYKNLLLLGAVLPTLARYLPSNILLLLLLLMMMMLYF